MTESNEHPLLKSARREAVGALAIWLVTTIYCIGYCCMYGYLRNPSDPNGFGRDPASLTYILGFPDWIFWGIVVPWGACTIVSGLFAFCFMKDADLDH